MVLMLFATALGLTALPVTALAARAPRRRVTIGGAAGTAQRVTVRRGTPLLVVSADIRPHRLMQLAGPDARIGDVRLERPGAVCELRFQRRGTYTLRTHSGDCLVPWLEAEAPRRDATIEVVVR